MPVYKMAWSFYNSNGLFQHLILMAICTNMKCSFQSLTVTAQMKNPMEFWKFSHIDIHEKETRQKPRFSLQNPVERKVGEYVESGMRHKVVEFRTPQHPSLGKNNWGGASPLLARSIPQETLEQRYLKLNSSRTRDEIFPLLEEDDESSYYLPVSYTPRLQRLEKSRYIKRSSFLSKLRLPWKGKTVLGSHLKKTWFQRWDSQNRWPQGWC